jgi:mannosyltransferase
VETADISCGAAPRPANRSVQASILILTILALITGVAAWLRFHHLAAKTFWFDEGMSVGIARLDWYDFARILWRREGNMSLYYLLLRFWLHFGNSEGFIRALSAIFALATVPALYALGRRLFDSQVGLIAATLLAVDAYAIRYAQDARSYSLLVFLLVLSSLYFLRCLDRPSRGNRIAYVVISALSVYAHFFAGLFVAAQWVSLYFLDPGRIPAAMKKDWRWIGVAVFPTVAFVAATGAGPLRWLSRPGLKDVWTFIWQVSGNGGVALVIALAAACAIALLPAWPERKVRRVRWESWRYRFLLLWLAFPPLLTLLLSFARPIFYPRYLIGCMAALLVLAAVGLARLRPPWLLAPAGVLLVALLLHGTFSYYQHDFDDQRENWRGGVAFLLAHARPDDGVLFHIAAGRLPYEYYRSLAPSPVPSPQVLYPHQANHITFLDFVQKPDYGALARQLPRYPRVWLVFSQAGDLSKPDEISEGLMRMLASGGYRETGRSDFDGLEIRLYIAANRGGEEKAR